MEVESSKSTKENASSKNYDSLDDKFYYDPKNDDYYSYDDP